MGFGGASGTKPAGGIHASPDCWNVRCKGREFRRGPIQAQVVRILHATARPGEPWQSGKAVLSPGGSRRLKMADVFKSQKNWPLLMETNGGEACRPVGLWAGCPVPATGSLLWDAPGTEGDGDPAGTGVIP